MDDIIIGKAYKMQDVSDNSNKKSGTSLITACLTVFISSFCIMVIELVAGRIIARFLGSSIYTWTSVIGVVLTGITIGNYAGGRIADAFKPQKSLAFLFVLASAAAIITVALNNLVGTWTWLWYFSWPVRVFLHVSMVFLLPSTLLGTISPVVAKMALERGLPTGRTVGDIYAWGAAGSIFGTFATGYYLIAMMGTIAIVWAVAAVMLFMALLYGLRFFFIKGAALLIIITFLMGIGPWGWTKNISETVKLREKPIPGIIYENETPYCYVAVKQIEGTPEKRVFVQDTLVHSEIEVGNISALKYSYEQIMAAITHRFTEGKKKPNFLILGGGGYVLPRYLENYWPQGSVDVVEIDPGITKAATVAFELDPATKINTITLDARNYVDSLVQQEKLGHTIKKYDFIYEDALNDYSIPFQLTTKEFNEKIFNLLNDDGIYMVEMIDTLDSALFVGSFTNTLKLKFPFVAVLTETDVGAADRDTFVAVAAKHQLDLKDVCKDFPVNKNLKYLDESDFERIKKQTGGMILTDNYAPVENLLAPVVKKNLQNSIVLARQSKAYKIAEKAQNYAWKGDLDNTIRCLDEIVRLDPSKSVRVYYVMAQIFTDTNKYDSAVKIYERAFEKIKDDDESFANELADLHYNYAALLQKLNKNQEAAKHYSIAQTYLEDAIKKDPQKVSAYSRLGSIFAENGDFKKAVECFQKAVDLNPIDLENQMNLIHALQSNGQIDSAIEKTLAGIDLMSKNNKKDEADKLGEYLGHLESQRK
jgi:tetratricopeptide (TPR) repeat protein/MFS family permease